MNFCSGSVLHILYLSSTCGPPATVRLLLRTQSRTLPLAVTNAPGPPGSIWTPCGRGGLVRRYALREPTSRYRTLGTHNNYSLATELWSTPSSLRGSCCASPQILRSPRPLSRCSVPAAACIYRADPPKMYDCRCVLSLALYASLRPRPPRRSAYRRHAPATAVRSDTHRSLLLIATLHRINEYKVLSRSHKLFPCITPPNPRRLPLNLYPPPCLVPD